MNSRNILDHFSELADPREDNKRHKLFDISLSYSALPFAVPRSGMILKPSAGQRKFGF